MKLDTAAHTSLVMALEDEIVRRGARPPSAVTVSRLAWLEAILEELRNASGSLEWSHAVTPFEDDI